MKYTFSILSLLLLVVAFAQEEERKMHPYVTELYLDVPMVTPGEINAPPSDAIVLFDGKDLSEWKNTGDNSSPDWKIENSELVIVPGTKSIETKRTFGDVQLHIEWQSPVMVGEAGQGYGNSGVFLMGLYELQVLNSYDSETYSNGQAGSIYKQHAPLVNASRPPGTWQKYDIIFTTPKFSEKGTLIAPARMTVLHNGVLIQNNVTIQGPMTFTGLPQYREHSDKLPLMLQHHGDPVRYRNIWIREL